TWSRIGCGSSSTSAPRACEWRTEQMGGLNKTGVNAAHDAALVAAEGTRQAAVIGVPSSPAGQATVSASEIAFHRAVIASCKANNSSNGLAESLMALKSLGVNS